MTPFHEGWRREVVYRHANPHICDIYYLSPDGTKLRSKTKANLLPDKTLLGKKTIEIEQFTLQNSQTGKTTRNSTTSTI